MLRRYKAVYDSLVVVFWLCPTVFLQQWHPKVACNMHEYYGSQQGISSRDSFSSSLLRFIDGFHDQIFVLPGGTNVWEKKYYRIWHDMLNVLFFSARFQAGVFLGKRL